LINEEVTRDTYLGMFVHDEAIAAKRTTHPSIPPPNQRIKDMKTHDLKGYENAVEAIKLRDLKISKNAQGKMEKELDFKHSLTSANLGSVYDVPVDASTKAGSSEKEDHSAHPISFSNASRKFELTERAQRKLPFNTFYTTNLTDYDA
jgi:hypothetical protein